MPAPAVYVIAVLGTVAAGLAFKEFVYDPHIAPKIIQWRHDYVARREARRRSRMPVVVSVSVDADNDSDKNSSESNREGSPGYEMEMLNPAQSRARIRTLSKEGIESWRTGIQSAISTTSLRTRNHGQTSSSSGLTNMLSSTPRSSATPTDVSRQTLVPIYIEAETGAEMNTHILTDVDSESIAGSASTSSVRQMPSDASIISSFDFTAPGTPAPSSTITISTNNTVTNPDQHDTHDLSSLSSLGSLQNLARMPNLIDVANTANSHLGTRNTNNIYANMNPFADPNLPAMSPDHLSSPSFTYPSNSVHLVPQAVVPSSNPFNPESNSSSPSLIPSLSLSHPIPRADIEDGVVLLSPPSTHAYSLDSAPTSRAMSPAISEAFTSLSGVSEVSGRSGVSMPASASASVESLSEFSDFSVLESTSERSGYILSPHQSPRPLQQAMQASISGRMSEASQSNGDSLGSLSSLSGRNDGGTVRGRSRYLTREEVQHLIDEHSTRATREA